MDLYQVLGIDASASDADIKRAYRKLARQYHPDVNKDPGAQTKFNEVQKAYDILSDSQKRAQYDQYGVTDDQPGAGGFGGFGGGGFGGFGSMEDIFDSVFGGGGRRGQQRATQGDSLRYDCTITLEDVVDGCTRTVEYEHLAMCKPCDGSGAKPGSSVDTCSRCQGSGEIQHVQQTMLGQFAQITTCPDCRGEGKTIKDKCTDCKGHGVAKKTKSLDLNIPAGIGSGTKLRVDGGGNAGQQGGPPGDLYVVIHVRDHAVFERDGDDLYSEETISFVDALLGAQLDVKTIEGTATLRIPEGTQPGTRFRLKSKGIKHLKGFGRGDQYVKISVDIPKKLSKKQRKIIESFQDAG